jgi:4-amino-4-deoxy-L-arabinose transferase-like glycosyltransferase
MTFWRGLQSPFDRRFSTRRRELILAALIVLILVGAAMRGFNLGAQSMWRDEAISWNFARLESPGALVAALIEDELHPPLWYLVLHGSIRLWGDSEFGLRFQAVLFSVLLIPLGYALGRLLFGEGVGLLNATILSLSPFLLEYAQEARVYSFLAFVVLLALYFVARWLRRPTRLNLVGYALAMAAVLYTHNWGFFVLAALNAYVFLALILDAPRRRLLLPWIAGNALAGVIYLPWLPPLIQQLGYDTGWMATQDSPLVLLVQTLQSWTSAWSATPLYAALFLLGLASLVTVDSWRPFRLRLNQNTGAVLLLAFACLGPILIALGLSQLKPIYKPDRYTIIAFPAFSLLLAVGLATLRWRWLVIGGLVVVAVLALRKDWYYLTEQYKSTMRDTAAYVSAGIGPQDVIVFAPDPLGQSFNYYFSGPQFQIGYPNWNAPRAWHIGTWVQTWFAPDIQARTLDEVAAHLSDGACVWLVYTPGPVAVPGVESAADDLRAALAARYSLRDTQTFPEIFEYADVDVYCDGDAATG